MTRATADGQKDGFALAREAGASGVRAQLVKGTQPDLAASPAAGQEIEFVLASEEGGPDFLRHSTAHVMAQAVLNLHPEAKYSIGPPIEDGFYYDFDVERPFTPEDVAEIEAEMRRIVEANQRFERDERERDE